MHLEGKIFLTGGTGTIGRALIRRAERENWPCIFTIYSRDEVKQSLLKARYPNHICHLGDIRDVNWMSLLMQGHNLVIHAAAYKQIPSAECNVSECIETNVLGSRNVARAACVAGVKRIVAISTDKAVCPINLYGATKMSMERLWQQDASSWSSSVFTVARYGNVVGSTGSIVPFFTKQYNSGGFVTVTDIKMTRFYLDVNDAVDIILQACESPSGTVIIPKAKSMSTLAVISTLFPDAEIKLIGKRPGEKIHELLLGSHESPLSEDCGWFWRLYPCTGERINKEFEYSSVNCPPLLGGELIKMVKSASDI